MKSFQYKLLFGALLVLALAVVLPISTIAKSDIKKTNDAGSGDDLYQPLGEHSKISHSVIRTLNKYHYKNLKLNDQFSSKLLDYYLEALDPGKNHFLLSDIKEFEQYRYQLDDQLKRGDLKAAFKIYNRFHQRRLDRLNYMLEDLPKRIEEMDFTRYEYIKRNRENNPWLLDESVAKDLWRRTIKNDVLNLKLSDKSTDEISMLLGKRYSSQLRVLKQINNNDVFEIFMSAYTHGYDPHTDYLPPRESENFDIHMSLSLEGIGALLQREDEYIKVVRLIPAGPADRSKLLEPADRIIGVGQGKDGEIIDVIGWRLDDVVDLIRGPKGSIVKLNLLPSETSATRQTKIISLTRDTVKLEEQSAQKRIIEIKRDKTLYKIGVIELPTFYVDFKAQFAGDPDYRSSTRDVERLIYELREEQIDGLVIDLRNNGGGSLQEANDLTGLFIKTGPVVQIRDAKNAVNLQIDKNPKVAYHGPIAVLVNRLSASASEIFAGAIQDHGRGIVVGSQTFGKGTVQNINRLQPGQLKYTQAKFYRVSGDSTQVRGIIPDILMPEQLNDEEIGENTLPEALPWDQIAPVRFTRIANLQPIIDLVRKQHQQRIIDHPDFEYLLERIAFLEESRKKENLSLNEKERIAESARVEQRILSIANKHREAKGLTPFKDFEEWEAYEDQEDAYKPSESLLQETGHILIDWLTISQSKYALH